MKYFDTIFTDTFFDKENRKRDLFKSPIIIEIIEIELAIGNFYTYSIRDYGIYILDTKGRLNIFDNYIDGYNLLIEIGEVYTNCINLDTLREELNTLKYDK